MELNTAQERILPTSFLDLSLILIVSAIVYGAMAIILPIQLKFEAYPSLIIHNSLLTGHWLTPSINGAKILSSPPLYYIVAGLWSKLFGLSYHSLRLLSLLCALLNTGLMYITLRYLLTRGIALLSSLILVSSFLFFSTAILAGAMQFSLLLFSCAFYALICIIYCEGKAVKHFSLCYWLALALLTCTNGIYLTGLFFLAVIVWSMLINQSFFLKRLHSIRGYILFLVITLPWFIYAALHNEHFLQYYFIDTVKNGFLTLQNNNFIPNWSLFIAILLGFMPWAIFISSAVWYNHPSKWLERSEEPLGLLLISFPAVLALGLILTTVHNAWAIFAIPSLAILCGRYLAPGLQQKDLPLKNSAAELLFLSIIVIAAFYVSHVMVNFQFNAFVHDRFYQYVITFIILSVIIALPILRYGSVKKGFITLVLLSVVTYFAGSLAIKFHNKDDNQPIAEYILKHKQPGDIVASYHQYPEAISLMLGSNLVMIDWQNMPSYAALYQNHNNWATNSKSFWKIIRQNHKPFYVIVPKGQLVDIVSNYPFIQVLKKSNDLILVGAK